MTAVSGVLLKSPIIITDTAEGGGEEEEVEGDISSMGQPIGRCESLITSSVTS